VKKHSPASSDTPNSFLAQHQANVIGVLSGFDRLRFKGSLPPLYHPRTMDAYLQVKGMLFKDFRDFAAGLTARIKAAAQRCGILPHVFPVRQSSDQEA
jgi:hypothetical protein